MSIEGLQTWPSAYGAAETMHRLKSAIAASSMVMFAHVDHAAAAKDVGLSLPPIDLLIFGNPRAGTRLMNSTPTMGIDLPLKALIWEDADGSAWLAFNAPNWIATRHSLPVQLSKAVSAISTLQTELAMQATSI